MSEAIRSKGTLGNYWVTTYDIFAGWYRHVDYESAGCEFHGRSVLVVVWSSLCYGFSLLGVCGSCFLVGCKEGNE